MARLASPAVAAVFLAAGLLKIWDPAGFAFAIARLRILPHALIGPAAILLPWVEVVAAAAILARPPWRAAGKGIVAALLIAFTAALAVAAIRGGSSCGCFGVEGGFFSRLDVGLARNVLLLALLALGERQQAHAGARQAQAAQAD
ncbi:MAG TPA: MauE/DoxX family redox-associated membrane protein [Planctomycetota bacterium]